jgi:hypothetical protein
MDQKVSNTITVREIIQDAENHYKIILNNINDLPISEIKQHMKFIKDKTDYINGVLNSLIIMNADINKLINDAFYPREKKEEIELVEGVKIKTQFINSYHEIPNIPIYYNNNHTKFAIKINNVLLKGNIGDIGKNLHHSAPCKYDKCKKANCTYYHESNVRNFNPMSWIYQPNQFKPNKLEHNGRFVASKKNLLSDLTKLSKENLQKEINNYKSQIIHDLLILSALCEWTQHI